MPASNRFIAEFFGTFWLVFGGCGSAVLAASFRYAEHSPGSYSLVAAFAAETILTFFFLFIILGSGRTYPKISAQK